MSEEQIEDIVASFREARSVEGCVVLVTGAGSGIGRATAALVATAGAHVIITDQDGDAANMVTYGLRVAGLSADSMLLDVSNHYQLADVVEFARSKFGRLDVLVNNAGVHRATNLDDPEFESAWELSHAVMLEAPQRLIRAFLPLLRQAEAARIINIASIEGLASARGNVAYSSAKAGVMGLTRALAVELGREGITVNAVCPGPVESAMTAEVEGDARDKYLSRYTILNRAGQPSEIAHAVLNLAMPASAFVTGSAIIVDGGLLARST